MKPIVILIIGGISLAATLALTSWLSVAETHPAANASIPDQVNQPLLQEAPRSSTNHSRYHHRHSRKWGKSAPQAEDGTATR